jgi:alpha-L-fucosidase 2
MKYPRLKDDIALRQPAACWQDALPTGNGTVGALVYGNISNEIIVLNHEDLWYPLDKPQPPEISAIMPDVRELLGQGQYREAYELLKRELKNRGYPRGHIDPYHPAFDIAVQQEAKSTFYEYRRSLVFETGEVRVTWKEENLTFNRTVFVSRADDVVVLYITGSSAITSLISLNPHPLEVQQNKHRCTGLMAEIVPISFDFQVWGNWMSLAGQYEHGGEFGGLAKIETQGGKIRRTEKGISVSGANEILLLLKLFANEPSEVALSHLRDEIESLPLSYQALLERHESFHRTMYRRGKIDLRTNADKTTDEMMMQAYDGNVSDALIERMALYGRYLLVSSSRPGGRPANLSGIWNGDFDPPYSSDFHHDINIEMNYWQALPGHLAETTLPYFDYYESLIDDWRKNAQAIYGCRGVLANICGSTHGVIDAVGPWEVCWTAGAGWIVQLFYDYWLFTGDREFLEKRAAPFMREVALFYEDFLIEDEKGRYIFSPSYSPENRPQGVIGNSIIVNATMDVAIAREVLSNLCSAYQELGMESEESEHWQNMLDKMPEYRINEEGAMSEWLPSSLKDRYSHRHLSHLYPIYPGLAVTEETNPTLFEAGRIAAEKRLLVGLKSQTGWSLAQLACTFARLGDGNRALECLELLLRSCVGDNLLTYHNDWRGQGIGMFLGHGRDATFFSIDGNFGFTAAVQEMLLSSRPGFVYLLPALPGRWVEGGISGLRCRGGITVSIEWNRSKLKACMESDKSQRIIIKCPSNVLEITAGNMKASIYESVYGNRYREIDLPGGDAVRFSIILEGSANPHYGA